MKMKTFGLWIVLLSSLVNGVQADYIILKNGEKKEGFVLSQTATSVRMKYRVVGSIYDEKEFPMSEVKEVFKQTPEQIELAKLVVYEETPDMMGADEYERIILEKLRPFVTKFSGTKEATQVSKMIEKLQAEKNKILNGEVKSGGVWLSAEEVKRKKYSLDGYRRLSEIRKKIEEKKWVEALNLCEDFCKASSAIGYRATMHYPAMLEVKKTLIDKYGEIVLQAIADQPELMRKRNEGFRQLQGVELNKSKAAMEAEMVEWKAKVDADRRAGKIWFDMYKYDLQVSQSTQKMIAAEKLRIKEYDLELLKQQTIQLDEAISYLKVDIEKAKQAMIVAASLATGNKKEFKELYDVVAAMYGQALSTATVNPVPAAASGAAASAGQAGTATEQVPQGVDPKVAALMAASKAATTPAPTPVTPPPAVTPPATGASPVVESQSPQKQ
jgi:hypothetical protein